MSTVRMIYSVSGGRGDGTDWPPKGETLTVDDAEGAELVAAGIAEYADGAVPAAAPVAAAEVPAGPKPPRVNAPRADWVAHAVASGADPADADDMSKKELIAAFGNGGTAS